MSRTVFTAERPTPDNAPTLRQRIRKAFPLADGVTYVYAAGVMAATWIGADLLDKLGAAALGILR